MWLPDHARSGVACFFVISGFVIAYSTRNLGTRVQDAARFALRRQVRLDPPYYVVVLAVLLLGAVQSLVPGRASTSYSVTDIVRTWSTYRTWRARRGSSRSRGRCASKCSSTWWSCC